MQTYHNDPALKEQFVALLRQHQEADQIVQGTYWSDGHGCAVGCSIESLRQIKGLRGIDHSNHALYEELIGVPCILARLEDGIFEGLPVDMAREWPVRFAEAIPVGADLSRVWPQFAEWLLVDPQHGVIRFARTARQQQSIQKVADLYLQQLDGLTVTEQEWRSAAADAAAADADAAAADAAYAAYDAAYAAYDAAYAKHQARIRQADKLIELISACEVVQVPVL